MGYNTVPHSYDQSSAFSLDKMKQSQADSKYFSESDRRISRSEFNQSKLSSESDRRFSRQEPNESKIVSSSIDTDLGDYKPKFLVNISDRNTELNDKSVFVCEFYSVTEITSINWYHNGVQISHLSDGLKFIIKNERSRSMLCILNVKFEDSGIYEIRIQNNFGFTISSAKLTVFQSKIVSS